MIWWRCCFLSPSLLSQLEFSTDVHHKNLKVSETHWCKNPLRNVGECGRNRQTDRQTNMQTDMQIADCILRKHFVGTIFSAGHNYSQGSQSHTKLFGTIWMIYCKVSLSDHGYWELMVLTYREAVGNEVGWHFSHQSVTTASRTRCMCVVSDWDYNEYII